MKKLLTLILAAVCVFTLSAGVMAADGEIMQPSSDFYVTDMAGTLSQTTKDLIDNASGPLEQECDGAQICVVTINYLPDGYDSEQYAWLLFNNWGVGSAEANNGMLLLHVVMEDRGWLAIGAGLTNQLSTDEINSLLDEYFWPLSDAGQYDEAVANLFPHLIDVYEGIYNVDLYGGTSSGNTGGNDYVQPQPDYGDQYYDDYYDSYYGGYSVTKTLITIFVVVLVVAVLFGGIGGAGYYRRRRYGGLPMFFFCGGPGGPGGPRPPRGPRPPFGGGGGGFHGGGFGGGGFGGGGGFHGGGFGGGGHAGGGGGRR